MWRTMYKLTKSFSDVPGPKRIADSVRTKIDKFKAHLPLLQTVCNPGIRDRHWDQVRTEDFMFFSGYTRLTPNTGSKRDDPYWTFWNNL